MIDHTGASSNFAFGSPVNTVGMDRRRLVASKKQCRGARINFASGRRGRASYYILPHPPVHSSYT
jgi:hypothetical protein